jgi:hypothetical protein
MRHALALLVPLLALAFAPGCWQRPAPAPIDPHPAATAAPKEQPMSATPAPADNPPPADKSMDEVQEEHQRRLLAIPGVVGMGQGLSEGKPCFRIYVAKLTPELSAKIPKTIEGYPVVVIESGKIKAL